jgi:ribonuclease D
VSAELVDDADGFAEVVEELSTAEAYAVDTEFHRERTYFAQLALVQLGWDDKIVLVDPLAVDIAPLAKVFAGNGLAIMHACRQDLEVLERHCGRLPNRMVDTQLMAGFVGYVTPSLANLVEKELGVRLPKADRLTDWLRRPLSEAQLRYAASDVAHLVEIESRLRERLAGRGRLEWFEQAMAEMLAEPMGPRDPDEAWRRIKELRHLKGRDLGIARQIAAWRERRAAATDVTPRFVLSDLAVVGVAVARPRSVDELRAIRGVDGRALRSGVVTELLEVVADAVENPPPSAARVVQTELPAELRPALPLVSAWVTQVSRDLEIEGSLLATRSDLEGFLRGDDTARLAHGWRAELVGTPIRRLLAGEVAIAFERSGGLVLEPRAT